MTDAEETNALSVFCITPVFVKTGVIQKYYNRCSPTCSSVASKTCQNFAPLLLWL